MPFLFALCVVAIHLYNSACDGTDIKLSEIALAITTMAQQQLTIIAAVNSFGTSTDNRTIPAIDSTLTSASTPIAQR
jgi:hypothetical protein